MNYFHKEISANSFNQHDKLCGHLFLDSFVCSCELRHLKATPLLPLSQLLPIITRDLYRTLLMMIHIVPKFKDNR